MINPELLHEELLQADLPLLGVTFDGKPLYIRELTAQEQSTANTVLAAHDGTRQTDQQQERAAKVEFRSLPQWATWTPQQGREYVHGAVLSGQTADEVEAWINTNVTSLATAKTALILLARNLVTLREIVATIALAVLYLRDVAIRRQ